MAEWPFSSALGGHKVAESKRKPAAAAAGRRAKARSHLKQRTQIPHVENQRRGIKGSTDVQREARRRFRRDRISYREERKEREENGVIANKEEKGSRGAAG